MPNSSLNKRSDLRTKLHHYLFRFPIHIGLEPTSNLPPDAVPRTLTLCLERFTTGHFLTESTD
jgi:hypothetical protein